MSDVPAAPPPDQSVRPEPATGRLPRGDYDRLRRRASARRVHLDPDQVDPYLRDRLRAMMPPPPPNPVTGATPGHV